MNCEIIKKFISILSIFCFIITVFSTIIFALPVHNRTTGLDYPSITSALNSVTNNSLIEVDPGTYTLSIKLSNLTNVTLRATAWTQNRDFTQTKIKTTVFITNGNKNDIIGFTIRKAGIGIYITGVSFSNSIKNNLIWSNWTGLSQGYGICLDSENVRNNYIISNTIGVSFQKYGIYITNAKYNTIRENKVYNNTSSGIYITGSASYNEIFKNDIYENWSSAIYLRDEDSDKNNIHNNNIWGTNQNTGIIIYHADNNVISTNNIYNNEYNGILLSGNSTNNILKENDIYQNDTSGIKISTLGLNKNFVISNEVWGNEQDYGIQIWFGNNTVINYNKIYNNEWNGISMNHDSTNNLVFKNTIYNNTTAGISIYNTKRNNYIVSNNIYGASQNTGIRLNLATNVIIESNYIHDNDQYGIRLSNSSGNNVIRMNDIKNNGYEGICLDIKAMNNIINNNSISYNMYGIRIFPTSSLIDKNIIMSNSIFENDRDGIFLYKAKTNIIKFNKIYKNKRYGIRLWMSSESNKVMHNSIYSNNDIGLLMSGNFSVNNSIISNYIWGMTQDIGIQISNVNKQYLSGNDIHDNLLYGINISDSTNTIIEFNTIRNQTIATGIKIRDSNIILKLNNIISNETGLYLGESVEITNIKNNIYDNINFNCITEIPLKLTNNWWGYTIASDIANKFSNYINYSNFTPYRLFGPFDTHNNADTYKLPSISWVTGYVSGNDVEITWKKPSNTSDFNRYLIYRSTIPGTTNISVSNVIYQIFNENITNYIDSSPNQINYYYINSVDSHLSYPNESWYSSSAMVVATNIPLKPKIINIVSVSPDSIDITWNDVSFETSYTLFRNVINDTNSATNIAGFKFNKTNFLDLGLATNQMYYYWLKSYNNYGYSSYSTVTNIKTLLPALQKPEILIISVLSPNSIELTWNDISFETSYTLFRNLINDTNSATNIVGFSNNVTNYIDVGLTPNTTYHYWIKAYNNSDYSTYSEEVNAKTSKTYEENLINLIIGPNPCKRCYPFYFTGLTEKATIKIFNVAGGLICTLEETDGDGKYEWDMKNEDGQPLASGVYICYITNPKNEERIEKIMIIR